ncbi:PREDICTED: cytochrome P450 86B1-like [Populus euphratica]|uniref:Cytochrome P450 86B1-like n=1 Tax=Populus euphratica TaxID=75702 RepID=A0AAJ6XNY4_POPEU|nr:PREDICTED: cytochrome P450 86B1-like [Populus euphratica]
MTFIGIFEIFLAIISYFFFVFLRNRNEFCINWPLVGMLPNLFLNVHRFLPWSTELAERNNGSYLIRGPWFFNMDILATIEPANVHHIMSTNFSNYHKGPEFQKMFDIFGDGLFIADSDSWKNQRKIAMALTTHRKFYQFLVKTTQDKVEKGLIPVLEHVSKQGLVVDLQSLIHRFSLDVGFKLVTGHDRELLSIENREDTFSRALDDAEEVIYFRYLKPEILWKLQGLLGFGPEQKMKEAWEIIDQVAATSISKKREELRGGNISKREGEDLLTSYIKMEGEIFIGSKSRDEFMRDTIVNFLIAGRENCLAWFFWLVFKNPRVEARIREELQSIIPEKEAKDQWWLFHTEELKNLVYLQAALFETLRLYPAVPVEHKKPIQPDILPSGHHVNPKMKIVFLAYAMGRMTSIWGKDCLEFKPERFISERGGMKHVPTNKFVAFNTGPRTCIGKNIALTQMKAMAANIIYNYHVQVMEGHPVVPAGNSILLHMKHGLMVRIARRWA